MKYPLTFILISAAAIFPAAAETAVDSSLTPATTTQDPTDAATIKKKAREVEKLRDEKIKDLEKAVLKDSSNKDCRLALVDYLEAQAAESEGKDDWPGAWRFYQRAAAVLRDPTVAEWETRASADLAKATGYRVKQTDKIVAEEEAKALLRRTSKTPPIVAPALDWKTGKNADSFAENRYREEVWKRVQTAWVNSTLRKAVKDTSSFRQPAEISFDVHSDGEVTDIKITKSSGDRRIDLAALRVVEDLGKVEPLLPGMGSLVRFKTEFGK